MKGPHFLFTAIDLIKNIELKGINREVIFGDSLPEWLEVEAYPPPITSASYCTSHF
jgi:hypothetical protein